MALNDEYYGAWNFAFAHDYSMGEEGFWPSSVA